MIWYQNQTTPSDFTLTESTYISATTPYYLFHLYSPTSHEDIFFTGPNISTNTVRYDRFNITLTSSTLVQNLTAGTIYVQPNGRWNLNVYQMSGETNLDLSGTTGGPIETMWIQISGGTSQNYITNQYTGGTKYYQYYQPQNF